MTSNVDGPATGRHATGGSFSLSSTSAVPAGDGFDYWRRLFLASFIDRQRDELANPFRGNVLHSHHYEGVSFAHIAVDPHVCRFGLRDSGMVLLGMIRSGSVAASEGDKRRIYDSRDGLLLFDCDRPATLAMSRYDVSYLVLPRYVVANAIGGSPAVPDAVIRRIPDTPIARMLVRYLDLMTEDGAGMGGADAFIALKCATDMAVAALSHANPALRREGLSNAIAAKNLIAQNFARPDLTASMIAEALGCSRSHLYRLFDGDGMSVGEHLRQVRLAHAHRLLQCERDANIADIAYRSGYSDVTAFGKAFKRQYGMSPGDHRAVTRRTDEARRVLDTKAG